MSGETSNNYTENYHRSWSMRNIYFQLPFIILSEFTIRVIINVGRSYSLPWATVKTIIRTLDEESSLYFDRIAGIRNEFEIYLHKANTQYKDCYVPFIQALRNNEIDVYKLKHSWKVKGLVMKHIFTWQKRLLKYADLIRGRHLF